MENRNINRDFEHFVSQNADQYRMFPSEKVWKNIHHNLHQRNRWKGAALSLLFLTTATVTGVMLMPSNRNIRIADRLPQVSTTLPIVVATTSAQPTASPVVAAPRIAKDVQREESSSTVTISPNFLIAGVNSDDRVAESELAIPLAPAAIASLTPHVNLTATPVTPVLAPARPMVVPTELPAVVVNSGEKIISAPVIVEGNTVPVDEWVPADVVEAGEQSTEAKDEIAAVKPAAQQFPLTIESVLNLYNRKKNRLTLQAYFVPTISYRKLKEDNQFLSETQSRATPTNTTVAISDVENIVTHKPDFGLQLGVNTGYSLSPRLTFVSGLQFNVNKYDIRAYNHPAERGTIALMSSPYNSSVETETTYRNYSGSRKADWLHNLYFSASLPIGLQYRVSAPGATEIGVAGTIQPTYILGNRAYLLTTDYKNYVEVPSLIRKWNMSTSFELYAGFSTGKIDWRAGPQVRYQLFSSYKPEYPVKEHLFDFGLKVGIVLNK